MSTRMPKKLRLKASLINRFSVMTDLYIFGAAGFAAETALIAKAMGSFRIAAFIEADGAWMPERSALELTDGEWIRIMPQSEFVEACPEGAAAAIAIADAAIAHRIAKQFDGQLEFPNIIHPSAMINAARIGSRGNIIYPGVIISWKAQLGNFNKLQAGVTIGHEASICDFNEFNPRTIISGRVTIGSDCLFGAACSVRQGLTITDSVTVGMGAVVVKNITKASTVVGIPAREIKRP